MMTPSQLLTDALAQLSEQGRPQPCHGSDDWISEDHDVRADAAARCHDCPVIELCQQYADDIKPTFGVWAGIDHDTKPKTKRRPGRPRKTTAA